MKKSLLVLAGIASIVIACNNNAPKEESNPEKSESVISESDAKLQKQAQSFFKVLPDAEPFGDAKTKLGKKLYYETALSVNNKISCNSCHMLDKYGVDNNAKSPGHDGSLGGRNSPTVYNAYFHISQFWDGRAADLKEQAGGPILNPVEMGMPDSSVCISDYKGRIDYIDEFKEVYPNDPNPVSFNNITDAIAAFEKTLSTPAPFDAYLAGDNNALSADEKAGLETFINTGCITCHMGPGLGGQMYQKFGLINGPYWDYTGSEGHDEGRFEATGNEADKYFFKVPALRNVEKTSPYFHDGSVADLGEAVKIMAKTQLNKDLTDDEVKSIVTFLNSLTGEIPAHALLAENN